MKKVKNERLILIIIRVIPFVINKFRNLIYGFSFRASGLRVGDGVSITGSKNIKIGTNVLLGKNCWLDAIDQGEIFIDDNVSFSQNVHVAAKKKVTIGKGCLIGSDVLITDHDHSFGEIFSNIEPKKRDLVVKGTTSIGENTWLADNVKILSGVNLGNNVVVAANSVVTRSFPDHSVIGGIPANLINSKKNKL